MGTADILDLTHRLPTCDEVESAAEAATALAAARDQKGGLTIPYERAGTEVRLAPAICDLLVDVLGHIAKGDMVTLVSNGALLTTQEAADMLNVSRPHLSKLLKDGSIPHVLVGSHRRVEHSDLMAYKDARDSGRRKTLAKLAKLGQEFDRS